MFRYNITTNLENRKFYDFSHDRKAQKRWSGCSFPVDPITKAHSNSKGECICPNHCIQNVSRPISSAFLVLHARASAGVGAAGSGKFPCPRWCGVRAGSPVGIVKNIVHCGLRLSVDKDALLLQLLLQILEICQLNIGAVRRRLGRGGWGIFTGWVYRHQGGRDGRDPGWGSGRVFPLSFFQHFDVFWLQHRHRGQSVRRRGHWGRTMALAEVSEFIILSISLFEIKFKIDLTRTNLCIQYSIKMWRILNVDKI